MGPHYCDGGLYISCIVMLVVVPLYAIIIIELLTYCLSRSVRYILFLVRFNNFDQTTGFYWSYTLLLKPPVLG